MAQHLRSTSLRNLIEYVHLLYRKDCASEADFTFAQSSLHEAAIQNTLSLEEDTSMLTAELAASSPQKRK
jgi:hypothetical protein